MTSGFLGEAQDKTSKQLWRTIDEKIVYPVLTTDKLLISRQRQKILADIKKLAAIPEEHFAALYQHLIDNFAEFVQVLPINNDARLCSLLDEGLLRALYALQVQRTDGGDKVQYLMAYVLFSATLLFDVGHVLDSRHVAISDRKGVFIRDWQPLAVAMQPADGFYRVWRSGGFPPWVCRRIATLLAKQLMPEIGFNWIVNDVYALNLWLALLVDDKEGAGALSLFFAQAMEWLKEFRTTQEFIIPIDIEPIETEETDLGVDFLNWLPKEIAISVNKPDSRLHVIHGGILLTTAAIKKFLQDNKLSVKEGDLLEALRKLGVNWENVKYQYLPVHAESFTAAADRLAKSTALFGGFHATPTQVAIMQAGILGEQQRTFLEGRPTFEAVMITLSGYSRIAEAALAAVFAQIAPNTNIIVSQPTAELAELPKISPTQEQTLIASQIIGG